MARYKIGSQRSGVFRKTQKEKKRRFKRKYILYIFAAWILANVLLFLAREYISNYYFSTQLPALSPENYKRILIFAPHCDDETLSSAGVIQKALAGGSRIKVVVMTNGDGFTRAAGQNFGKIRLKPEDYIRFGYLRQNETIHALEDLGVDRKDIIFLGYPDRGLRYLWEKYFDSKVSYFNSLTRTFHSPYSNSYEKNVQYKGVNVVRNIESIIKSFAPDLIIYPYSRDQHPDHWATSAFVKFTILKMGYKCEQWQYLVHRGDWPTPFGRHPDMFLVPPFKLAFTDTNWYQVMLDDFMIEKKTNSISDYHSQMKVMRGFLEAFVRQNELFAKVDDIIARKYQGDDLFSSKYIIMKEPTHDIWSIIFEKGADIDSIYAAHDSRNIYIGIKMAGSAKRLIGYYLHIRAFKDQKYLGRMYIQISGSKMKSEKNMTTPQFSLENSKFKRNKNYMMVTLPKKDLQNPNMLFLSLRTEFLGRQLDRSAWKVVLLK
ncbi:PIG-L deacetylase family protein [Caldicellulosiruptor morganii]|uniref:PIG-L family deacetylase n=1 Tax=Caldicellulosiruptor morganii TaxID=1387555 RepID=A0ABY7BPL4_9FIRM|nr:PIG-L family deacetylase [Caldicellulosiruptor morganii]WAM34001.1 PIG-L family deacetylase [Caldicellulosiruptor morganii]